MLLPPVAPAFPYTETLRWGTQIVRGASGDPQRIGRSPLPRQQIAYTYPITSDDLQSEMEAVLYGQGKDLWPIPLWGQRVRHAGPLAAGATTIAIDTTGAEFLATNDHITGRALVWRHGAYEIVTVSAVAAASLTTSALAADYPPGAWIVPCRTGYLIGSAGGDQRDIDRCNYTVTLEAVDNWFCTGHEADQTYDNVEIVTAPATFLGREQRSFDPDVYVIDAETGRRGIVNVADYPIVTQPYGWVCTTRAACYALRQRLHAWLGRQKSFLVPTWRPDLRIARLAESAATTIDVVRRGYTAAYNGSAARQYVACDNAGTLIARRITGVAVVDAATERLTVDAAFGVALYPARSLCWLDRCRLASDTVTLTWRYADDLTCAVDLVRTWRAPVLFGDGVFGMGVMAG